ncbi:MAG: hypothetical protein LLG37_05590 [Spirochaetia bacterium]|nr:hypothetical protein [Spirochaetia bacterium]
MKKTGILIVLAVSLAAAAYSMDEEKIRVQPKIKFLTDVRQENASSFFMASPLADECRLIRWEAGKMFYSTSTSLKTWKKYRDFMPEDLFIRMVEDKATRLLKPGKLDGFYFDKKNNMAVFIMYLGDSINGTLAVADTKKNRVIYTMPVKIHPNVPGRRMEFMAIENLISTPYLSADCSYAVFNMYNYMYFSKAGVLDLKTKKITEVDNGSSPYPIGDEVFFIHTDRKTNTKNYVRAPLTDPGKFTVVAPCDFTVNALLPDGETIYMLSGSTIMRIRPASENVFTIFADLGTFFKGYDRSSIARLFFGKCGEYGMFALVEHVKGDKYSYKLYGIGLGS